MECWGKTPVKFGCVWTGSGFSERSLFIDALLRRDGWLMAVLIVSAIGLPKAQLEVMTNGGRGRREANLAVVDDVSQGLVFVRRK